MDATSGRACGRARAAAVRAGPDIATAAANAATNAAAGSIAALPPPPLLPVLLLMLWLLWQQHLLPVTSFELLLLAVLRLEHPRPLSFELKRRIWMQDTPQSHGAL